MVLIKAVTLYAPEGPPLSRRCYQLGVEEWHLNTVQMLVSALDLLQDMTLSRRPQNNNSYPNRASRAFQQLLAVLVLLTESKDYPTFCSL